MVESHNHTPRFSPLQLNPGFKTYNTRGAPASYRGFGGDSPATFGIHLGRNGFNTTWLPPVKVGVTTLTSQILGNCARIDAPSNLAVFSAFRMLGANTPRTTPKKIVINTSGMSSRPSMLSSLNRLDFAISCPRLDSEWNARSRRRIRSDINEFFFFAPWFSHVRYTTETARFGFLYSKWNSIKLGISKSRRVTLPQFAREYLLLLHYNYRLFVPHAVVPN